MATKERLIVKTSYRDVLERMLRKRGVKVVMSGVREMTLAEEIRNLAELGVDQNVIDRMIQKYNRMLTDHGGKRRKGGAGGERNYHKSINNSYKRERATVRGSSI